MQYDDASSSISNMANGKKQLFTKNIVSVKITGPECEDLALVDLPGLIQSQEEKENEVYIGLVEGLVKEYLSRENTVIVSCIASDEDVEVSFLGTCNSKKKLHEQSMLSHYGV